MRFVQGAKKRKPSRVIGFLGPWEKQAEAYLVFLFF
jgi:hypothetical protein